MSGRQSVQFTYTNWNMDTDYAALLSQRQIRYVAYTVETAPSTGRLHHQGFLYFYNKRGVGKRSCSAIGELFKLKPGDVHAHVEPMRGSLLQNESYCSKQTAGVLIEHGNKPSPGARNDLDAVVQQIQAGEITPDDVAMSHPSMFHQYGRTLDRVATIALRRRWRTWMTQGIWLVGPPNAGKSHRAFQDYSPDTHYIKNLNEDWWDGYTGQETVLLNEFRGQIPFSELLDLVDKWPKTVRQRNREPVPFLAKTVIVTSVFFPKDVYRRQDRDEPWAQFERRFTVEELQARPANLG